MLPSLLLPPLAAAPPEVRPPALSGPVAIDGRLDEAVWREAAVIADFTRWRPEPGGPPPGRTEARIWYDAERLYLGFVCEDPIPGRVRAHAMPREDINEDDQIGIYLDTFGDERSAYVFWVNPLGVQQDYRDTVSGDPVFAWDAVWQSAGERTAAGYTIEVAIPWASLWYPGAPEQDWRIVLQRKIPADDAYYAWPTLDRDQASIFPQAAVLAGLRPPDDRLRLEVMPTLTARQGWSPAPGGDLAPEPPARWNDALSPGLDLRWGPSPDVSVDATINPDFSQVEADPFLLDLNARYALYLEEQRPFFLSGVDAYQDPAQTLYTRSIVAPLWGLKLTGRQGRTWAGALNAYDTAPGASLVAERETPGWSEADVAGARALTSVLRLRRDAGESFQVGALYAEKDLLGEAGGLRAWNRVGGADLNGTFAERYAATAQVRGSLTAAAGGAPLAGGSAAASLERQGTSGWGGSVAAAHLSPGFRAETQFLTRVGYTQLSTYQRYRFEPERLLYVQPDVDAAVTVDDDPGTPPEHSVGAALDVNVSPALLVAGGGSHSSELYAGERFLHPRAWLWSEAEPTGWAHLWLGLEGSGAVDYETASPARVTYANAGAALRPLPPLQVELSYRRQELRDAATGEGLERLNLWRGEANVQLTAPLGLRGLAQWRDDEELLQVSALLSWIPSPGTAAYLGFTQDLSGGGGGPAQPLSRAVFAKLSWLFRV